MGRRVSRHDAGNATPLPRDGDRLLLAAQQVELSDGYAKVLCSVLMCQRDRSRHVGVRELQLRLSGGWGGLFGRATMSSEPTGVTRPDANGSEEGLELQMPREGGVPCGPRERKTTKCRFWRRRGVRNHQRCFRPWAVVGTQR